MNAPAAAAFALLAVFLAPLVAAHAEPVSLFDGASLVGWQGDTSTTWRVEDGEIVAGDVGRMQPRNEFLRTVKRYGDFDLRLKIRLLGTEGFVNAGIQFRTEPIPNNHEVIGYQADFGAGYDGALYDESRRNKMLAQPTQEVLKKAVRPGEWNDYRIRAEGRRIRLWLNGVETVDYTEADQGIPQEGVIALQIHGNAKSQVRYKDIVIEELSSTAASDLEGASVPAVECRPRGGLPNFLAKARAGGDVRVAYFGGSITAAPGWRVQSLDWLKKEFPVARFAEINAAIGGTGSDLGAFRVGQDVIAHKPDLVFVEFAVNDGGAPPARIMATMEGIVRQILRADSATDICFVYTLALPDLPDLAKGVFQRSAAAMEAVAEHYAIPTVHFGVEVNRRIADGSLVFKAPKPEPSDPESGKPTTPSVFSTDGVHPHVETGHRLYAEVLAQAFTFIAAASTAAAAHPLPAPLRSDNWETAKLIPIDQSMLRGDWKRVTPADDERAKNFVSRMPTLWKAATPGAELTVAFTGTMLSVYDLVGPGGGMVAVRVDDQAPKSVPRIDGYCTSWRIAQLSTGSHPPGSHRATFTLEAAVPDKETILFEQNRPDLAKDPAKYADNVWYASAILLLGDLVPQAAAPPR